MNDLSFNQAVFPFWNKAGYMATSVACGWAGAVLEKVTGAFEQAQ